MTNQTEPFDDPPVGWDLSVLDAPVVLTLPDQLPDQPDPLLLDALETLIAFLLREPSSSQRIGQLAQTGIVGLHTSSGCLEVHETLLGWTLVHAAGTPDPSDLAAAARLRARRLAGERAHDRGRPS